MRISWRDHLLRLTWVFPGIVLGAVISASAQPTVGVVIMPFSIHAQPEMAYLKNEIPEAMRQQFAEDGANARVLDAETAAAWSKAGETDADLARMAIQIGADYVVTGSLTWIGQDFSIDARLLPSAGDRPARVFTAVGKGVENLPGAVKRLARDMGLTVFKRDKVVDIVIEGNQRIETDAIRRLIKTKVGDILVAKNAAEDLKAVYGMGYFEDVQIQSERQADGVKLIFKVTEKPTVRSIQVKGNAVFDEEEMKKSLTLKKGSILNMFTVRNDVRRIEDMYKEKNYHNVKVDFKLQPQKNNQVDVEYDVDEGSKILIKKILFTGNSAFSASTLKGEITTNEKNILSWITGAGDLNQDILNQDSAKLTAFYHNNGYVRARVGEPQVEFEQDGIVVTFKINEGPRFKLGKVDFNGDLILPKDELMKKLKMTKEPYYNREALRADVLALTDLYSDEGYAYVDISPKVDQDNEKLLANITFQIDKGKQVYFERIQISGNTKTRDKVIRRELRVYEQELYSGVRLKRGIRNLNRLDYFENVKVDTSKGSADDKMNMDVEVKEKNTGAFTIGAGYGSVERVFTTASISERNLFGFGQTLAVRGQLGAKTQKYVLSFTEPWLFDIPLSAGAEAYKWDYQFDEYDKDSIGGNLKFSYPIYEYVRGYLTYNYDLTDIRHVQDTAAESIQQDQGRHIKSSISPMVKYDSRDSNFNAKEGSVHSIQYEFAGVGGDVGFNKVIGETGWYFPLGWKLVGLAHGRAGYVNQLPTWDLPDYEKFYLGGMNSVRGGNRDDLAPKENGSPVGGEKFLQGNFEVKFPLVEEAGVFGIIFLDTGAVYKTTETWETHGVATAGPEIRWMSPIGPIRLAYGWYLNPRPDDKSTGGFEFSMASAF
ncbi:MAG: outer membrane protein assembly factor BamA [Hyphomicrobiales bacterium]